MTSKPCQTDDEWTDWWRSLSDEAKQAFHQEQLDIAADYGNLAAQGRSADSEATQDVVRRHVEWLRSSATMDVTRDYVIGLGDMYVDDPRFAKNYPGCEEYARDAMRSYAARSL